MALTTQYDGVTTNFNRYPKFDGASGYFFQNIVSGLSSYTMSIWVKLAELPYDTRKDMTVISFIPDAFAIQFDRRKKLVATSDRGGSFTIDADIRNNSWYMITLRSNSSYATLQLRELTYTIVSQDNIRNFFPFRNTELAFDSLIIGIGKDRKSDGLSGSIRNLRLLSKFYDDSAVQRIQFTYIYPSSELKLQILLQNENQLWNEADRSFGEVIGKGISWTTDYYGSLWCYTPPTEDNYFFVDFSKTLSLQTYNIPTSQLNTASHFITTLQVWFRRNHLARVTALTDPTEILFNHVNVTKVSFEMNDYRSLRVDALNVFTRPYKTLVGFNQWMFLQITSTSTYYKVQIYEANGDLLTQSTINHPSTIRVSSRLVQVAQNFNGNIQGLKYYRTDKPPQSTVHQMIYGFETTAEALMYFLFTQQGMATSTSFQNLAINSKSQSMNINGQLITSQRYFRSLKSTSQIGTVNEPLNFDGYTCKDNKEKLYFEREDSYISSTFTLNDSLRSFTVEFWVKTTVNNPGSSYFVAVQDTSRSKQTALAVVQESNVLRCYPFIQANQNLKLDYLDYSYDAKTWQHISCIYDLDQLMIQGTLFFKNVEQTYFNDIPSTQQRRLEKQTYNIFVNINPSTMKDGVQKSFYSEIRFWNHARPHQQIRNQRYQQLDLNIERSSLVSYMKLANGRNDISEVEIDFADTSLTKELTLKNTKWQQMSDMIVCPQGMYKGSNDDLTCYREGILDAQVSIIKTSNMKYIITPQYATSFRNSFLRDKSTAIYNYLWTLNRQDGSNSSNAKVFPIYLNRQRTQESLSFGFDEVSNAPGKYEMTLQITDKENFQQTKTVNFNFRTYRCTHIYDKDSKESLVYKDMETTKTAEDVVFTYDYSHCSDYEFDQTAMTFDTDVYGVTLSSKDHDRTAKSFILRRIVQSNLPSNDYFYIRIKGVWRNTRNKNDVIEQHLIYACRFIPKLIVTLTPNIKIVSKGQTLSIDYKATFSNLNTNVGNRTFTIEWGCPGKLNDFCKLQKGSTLRVNYDQVVNNGVLLFKEHNITLTAYTNFIQGDGLRYTQAFTTITWINLLPQANISMIANNQHSQVVVFQLNALTLTDDQIQLKWLISPSVNRQECFVNSDDRKQFVIRSSCLQVSRNYQVTSELYYRNHTQVIISQTQTFQIPSGPTGGKISCTKTSGRAFFDTMTCTTSDWVSTNLPLTYQFFIVDSDGNQVSITDKSVFANFTGTLPPTSRVIVVANDTQGFTSPANTTLTITYRFQDELQTKIAEVMQSSHQQLRQLNTELITNLQWISQALALGRTSINETILTDYRKRIPQLILQQTQNVGRFTNSQRQQFIRSTIQIAHQLSNQNLSFDITSLNNLQMSLVALSKFTQDFELELQDPQLRALLIKSQENILQLLKSQQDKTMITKLTSNEDLSNITAQMRVILTNFEQVVSKQLYEGQSYQASNSAFNMTITKYSRLANILSDVIDQQTTKNVSFIYPLSTALEPSDRQSFTVLNFFISPFIGSKFLNQTVLSNNTIYFSYRDDQGNYLSSQNVLGDIQMLFPYDFSPIEKKNDTTTCGYIKAEETQWENSSCSVTFLRDQNKVNCVCKHMSYYAIIDDYLRREKVPLDDIIFYNYQSLIPFGYMLLLYVVGAIYCALRDNQDFRDLSQQDESQGNSLTSTSSITISSLAFKRKVFFMSFNEKYSFYTLYRLYIKLLHPLFQLKNKFDPELPRYYKFMLLYTRIMVILGVSFYFLRNELYLVEMFTDDEDWIMNIIIVGGIVVGGALIMIPLPVFLYCYCRSKYRLVYPFNDQKYGSDSDFEAKKRREVVKNQPKLYIDANLPLKLLFYVNSVPCHQIVNERQGSMRFCSGNLGLIAKQLNKLEDDYESTGRKRDMNQTDFSHGITERKFKDDLMATQEFKPNTQQSQFTLRANQHEEFQSQNKYRSDSQRDEFQSKSVFQSNSRNQRITSNDHRHKPQPGIQTSPDKQDGTPDKRGSTPGKYDRRVVSPSDIEFERSSPGRDNILLEGGEEERKSPDKPPIEQSQRSHRALDTSAKYQLEGPEDNNFERTKSDIMMDSYIGSLESHMFADEKKELIEERNIFGRCFFNLIFLIINLGILAGIGYFYYMEEYYLVDGYYVWILVFFAAQFLGLFILDFIILLFMTCSVSCCCKKKKRCLALLYREALYIYEDYNYVVNFSDSKLQ